MALDRPQWLTDLSRGFKRHRQGRSGWTVEVMRDRLRVVSTELPPRPNEPVDAPSKRRAVTLTTPPGPATAAAALAEACGLFDAVRSSSWRWPDPSAMPAEGDAGRLGPAMLQRLADQLHAAVVGEKVSPSTMWCSVMRTARSARSDLLNNKPLLQPSQLNWAPPAITRELRAGLCV